VLGVSLPSVVAAGFGRSTTSAGVGAGGAGASSEAVSGVVSASDTAVAAVVVSAAVAAAGAAVGGTTTSSSPMDASIAAVSATAFSWEACLQCCAVVMEVIIVKEGTNHSKRGDQSQEERGPIIVREKRGDPITRREETQSQREETQSQEERRPNHKKRGDPITRREGPNHMKRGKPIERHKIRPLISTIKTKPTHLIIGC
jgi:hypothetical protein